MTKTINFAIVGCGNIGIRHAEKMQSIKYARLYAVCDVIDQKAKDLAEKYSCKYFTDYKEMLNDRYIDVVNICTPNGTHASISIDCMNSKKHVLCEKPMSLNIDEADKMIAAEKNNNVGLFVVKQNRFNPPVQFLKNSVKENLFGELFLITSNVFWNRSQEYYSSSSWRGTKKLDGGTLFTQCSHFLDLMIWLGGEVKSVFAKMGRFNHEIETEDTGTITLKFSNNAIGVLIYTTCANKKNIEGSLTVFGINGTAKIGGEYLNQLEVWNVDNVPFPKLEKGAPPNDYGTYKGSMSNHDKVIQNVVDVLLKGEKATTPAIEGRRSIEVMQAAYLSAETGKEVQLPLS